MALFTNRIIYIPPHRQVALFTNRIIYIPPHRQVALKNRSIFQNVTSTNEQPQSYDWHPDWSLNFLHVTLCKHDCFCLSPSELYNIVLVIILLPNYNNGPDGARTRYLLRDRQANLPLLPQDQRKSILNIRTQTSRTVLQLYFIRRPWKDYDYQPY